MILGSAVETGVFEPAGESAELRAAQAGDLAAFETLLRRHERRVLRVALRLLRNPADAEDAAQEVLVRLHKHLRRFDDERQLAPWLYRVTVNICRDLGRKRRHEDADALAAMPAAGPGPDELAGAAERRAILNAALACARSKP